ncbi:MAG: manganese catalase family protein [Clostridia bacterium]|nr:manganese catalase family protein [Clostridia bacterium]
MIYHQQKPPGGPDGELAASTRYLCQRFSMPYREVIGILTDVGTEELAHVEMISTILHQLTRNLKPEDIAGTPFAAYFVDHTVGTYPTAASGFPFTASVLQVKGDVLADLHEDLAAEGALSQKQPFKHKKTTKLKQRPRSINRIFTISSRLFTIFT